MKSWMREMSVLMLLSLGVVSCAADTSEGEEETSSEDTLGVDEDEAFEAAEHRGAGRGGRFRMPRFRRDGGHGGGGDGGGPTRPERDASVPTRPERDASLPTRPERDASVPPRPERDASVDPPVDAGAPPAPTDAGAPTTPTDDRDRVTLPDGGVIVVDPSCPNYSTLGQTVVGCCLPEGQCGLSTHLIDFPGLPKTCGSYAQGKMLDPSFSLPEKSCAASR